MIALEQARRHLETLGMTQAMEVLENRLDDAARRQLPYPEMLADLLGVEVSARREHYLTTRTRLAHLPFRRTLEEFDFGFQPSIDERQVKELASLVFVTEASNLLLLGPPGVGKTCCCLAIPSMLTAERKCPHDGACEIDAARTGKTSGTQQLTGRVYDDGAGSDTDGTERTPYQAHTGGIQGEGSSRNSSRQQRSQPCQCYTEHTGDRSSTSGSDQIRRSQPHAPERVAEGARGYRHRSRHVTQDTD